MRTIDDVKEQMVAFIDAHKAATGELPARVTITKADHNLLITKDLHTGRSVKPVVFRGVPIHAI